MPNGSTAVFAESSTCCTNSLYTRAGLGGSLSVYSQGYGALAYSNYGWTADPSEAPVFACPAAAGSSALFLAAVAAAGNGNSSMALPAGALNVSAVAAQVPLAALARVMPPAGYPRPRVSIDGRGFGNASAAMRVSVGGIDCDEIDVCHTQCTPCDTDADCAAGRTCSKPYGTGFCLRACNADTTCPCGGQCYIMPAGGGRSVRMCANAGLAGTSNPAALCASGDWRPSANSSLDARIECSLHSVRPAYRAFSSSAFSNKAGRRLTMNIDGDGVGAASRADASGSEGSSSARHVPAANAPAVALRAASRSEQRALFVLAQHPSGATTDSGHAAAQQQGSGLGEQHGQGRGQLARSLQGASVLPSALPSVLPTVSPSSSPRPTPAIRVFAPNALAQPAYSLRYGGLCAASMPAGRVAGAVDPSSTAPSGLVPVVVTVAGLASTGLDPGLLAAAGLNVSAVGVGSLPADVAAAVAAASVPFTGNSSAAGAYSLPVPLLNVSSLSSQLNECAVDADCLVLDPCSTPRCQLYPAGTAGAAAGFGCCVYSQAAAPGSCHSSDPQIPLGSFVAGAGIVPLPREVAGALPMPPPPAGLVNASATDMALRDRATNPGAILWDARSLWYSYWAGTSGATTAARQASSIFGSPYALSAAAYSDDAPVEQVSLPFAFPFFGAALRSLYVSPNGFLRGVPGAPCGYTYVSSNCGLGNAYTGLISPLTADFDPGSYGYAEIYRQSFNLSALAPTDGLPSLAAGSPALPSHAAFCASFMNMGLWARVINPTAPPNPGFATHVCVHGDGGVRLRLGQVLNVPAPEPEGWGPNTVVPGWGGPPNSSDWLSGVRSPSGGAGVGTGLDISPAFGDWQASSEDVPVLTPTNALLSRRGVRQGATAAFCTLQPVACASSTCGGSGSVLSLQWSLPGCGAGLDPLLFVGRTVTPTSLPRAECVFGGVAVPAQPVANPPGSQRPYRVECIAPAASALGASAAARIAGGGNVTVTVAMRLVLPATAAALVAGGNASFVAAQLLSSTTPSGYASMGTGPPAMIVDEVAGTAVLPLPVYAVDSQLRSAIPVGSNTSVLEQVLLPRALTFTFVGDGSTCGCSATSAAMCDECGVCGGDNRTRDCAGVCFGTAFIDECGSCSGGTTGRAPGADRDCNGICFGPGTNCPSGGGDDPNDISNAMTLTIIVIVALITCSLALFSMLAYCAWVALVQRRRFVDALWWDAPDDVPAPPPGLSQETLDAMPLLTFGEPAADGGAPANGSGGGSGGTDGDAASGGANKAGSPSAAVATNPMTALKSPSGAAAAAGATTDAAAADCGSSTSTPAAAPAAGAPGDRSGDDTCTVCLETYVAGDRVRVMPPCRHRFHQACADEWLTRSTACPVCRADLRGPVERAEQAAYDAHMAEVRAARMAGRAPPPAPAIAVAPGPAPREDPYAGRDERAAAPGGGGRRGAGVQGRADGHGNAGGDDEDDEDGGVEESDDDDAGDDGGAAQGAGATAVPSSRRTRQGARGADASGHADDGSSTSQSGRRRRGGPAELAAAAASGSGGAPVLRNPQPPTRGAGAAASGRTRVALGPRRTAGDGGGSTGGDADGGPGVELPPARSGRTASASSTSPLATSASNGGWMVDDRGLGLGVPHHGHSHALAVLAAGSNGSSRPSTGGSSRPSTGGAGAPVSAVTIEVAPASGRRSRTGAGNAAGGSGGSGGGGGVRPSSSGAARSSISLLSSSAPTGTVIGEGSASPEWSHVSDAFGHGPPSQATGRAGSILASPTSPPSGAGGRASALGGRPAPVASRRASGGGGPLSSS